MCDVKKYSNLYEDLKTLQPEDMVELAHASKNEDEREFYIYINNFLLQQKHVIENRLF